MPWPLQIPLPLVAPRWPEPLAHEPPDCTITLTAPVGATRPWTAAGVPPALLTMPFVIATGYRTLGIQAPPRVSMETLQSPSKLLRAKLGLPTARQAGTRTQIWVQIASHRTREIRLGTLDSPCETVAACAQVRQCWRSTGITRQHLLPATRRSTESSGRNLIRIHYGSAHRINRKMSVDRSRASSNHTRSLRARSARFS